MNRLVLSASLLERSAVRYTPAGLPAIDCRLAHASTVTEDGQPRQVSLEIRALAIGAMSRPLGSLALGATALFAGFLASTRNGRGLLFHITELSADAESAPSSPDSPPAAPLPAPI
ncbi:MAG: primosomal replication protein N [Burkholderiaceae bacterium]|nr:primosomal replication protein N [Burkholderiaceae bacterium]